MLSDKKGKKNRLGVDDVLSDTPMMSAWLTKPQPKCTSARHASSHAASVTPLPRSATSRPSLHHLPEYFVQVAAGGGVTTAAVTVAADSQVTSGIGI